ncbi:hypothetical protein SAMN05421664_3564 [Chryseobacterium soldanellicola]|uniref:Uncharacterized protein n=1 Tax=Chryseobacterium soldanellicola TaxID=311333 RepID=A0A1H1GC24_9FLAO|nr:hypothetical protein SAMN05421664_3564 [Chryseobacterium soldanellicola]
MPKIFLSLTAKYLERNFLSDSQQLEKYSIIKLLIQIFKSIIIFMLKNYFLLTCMINYK